MAAVKKPSIESIRFGSITIDGKAYKHDVVIRLDGRVTERKKHLSKAIYGSSHTVSLDEVREIYQVGAALLIVGTGMFGSVRLSDEALAHLSELGCQILLAPSRTIRRDWNETDVPAVGLIHITC